MKASDQKYLKSIEMLENLKTSLAFNLTKMILIWCVWNYLGCESQNRLCVWIANLDDVSLSEWSGRFKKRGHIENFYNCIADVIGRIGWQLQVCRDC